MCFASDAEVCPDDNLYRIIGVFENNVKLIKYDYANSNLIETDGDYNSYYFTTSIYSNYRGSFESINGYSWNSIDKTQMWKIAF